MNLYQAGPSLAFTNFAPPSAPLQTKRTELVHGRQRLLA
jgi:hypothetical protein